MMQAPWWAPRGYTRGAQGQDNGTWWVIAVGPNLPTIVEVGERRMKIDFPWWARGTFLRARHVRALIRRGVLR